MKLKQICIITAAALTAVHTIHAEQLHTLKVKLVSNNIKERVVCSLYKEQFGIKEKPFKEQFAKVINDTITVNFDSLSTSNYAMRAFIDENRDGEVNHGMFGPSEPIGFSGGHSLSLLSGLPTFEKLKFSVQSDTTVTITIK